MGVLLWVPSVLGADLQKLKTIYEGKLSSDQRVRIRLQTPAVGSYDVFTKLTLLKGSKEIFQLDELHGQELNNIRFPEAVEKVQKLFVILPLGLSDKQSVLVFSEYQGVEEGDKLTIINLSSKAPKIIYNKAERFTEFRDFNGDGLYDLLKEGGHGEPTGPNNLSYDPYLVYRQSNKSGKTSFAIDEKLSKQWSKQNKFSWRGSKYNGSIRVDQHGAIIGNRSKELPKN